MITAADIIMLNQYLQENHNRNQQVDKARITKSRSISLSQKQMVATDFDPLTDQEPTSMAVVKKKRGRPAKH